MATVDRVVTIRIVATLVVALISVGCDMTSTTKTTNTTGSLPVFAVTFSGSGHWEEVHPRPAPYATGTVNASVTWLINYTVDFANRTTTLISRNVTGSGSAAHASSQDYVCTGPIVADPTQTAGPTLDLVSGAFPTGPTGSATFQTQAMGGSAFHVCDPAWATGIHGFPGYDSIRGDAQIKINLGDWTIDAQPKTTYLPTVEANETEPGTVAGPDTLHVHWEGSFTVSKN